MIFLWAVIGKIFINTTLNNKVHYISNNGKLLANYKIFLWAVIEKIFINTTLNVGILPKDLHQNLNQISQYQDFLQKTL